MLETIKIKERKLLLKNFIKNPKLTANFLPSSRFLVKEILANINFKEASHIVEYGPSTGNITKHILGKSNKNTKLLCFDLNTEFCNYLKKNIKDQRLIVINDDAANVKKYLKKYNINHVDYIISGVPFSFIPSKIKNDIIKESKNLLKPGGKFIAYQCNPKIKKYLLCHFHKCSTKFIFSNMFPVSLFVCEKI